MTTGDAMAEVHDCGGDAAAYALGALDPSESEQFRGHVSTCVVCRDEIAAFEHVFDALATAVPELPVPRALRRRVMRALRAEPRPVGRLARAHRTRSQLSLRFVPRVALAGALLAAAALAVLGGLQLAPQRSSRIRVIQARVSGVPGRAQVRVAGARAELVVSHLPAPAVGQTYELWIQRGRHPPSPTGALFSVTDSGAAEVGVPGDVHGVSRITVTQEPAGGTRTPTRSPVISAQLS